MEHICNFGARYFNEKFSSYIFAEMLRVSVDILALAAVRIEGAEEVSSIFNGHKRFWMETRI